MARGSAQGTTPTTRSKKPYGTRVGTRHDPYGKIKETIWHAGRRKARPLRQDQRNHMARGSALGTTPTARSKKPYGTRVGARHDPYDKIKETIWHAGRRKARPLRQDQRNHMARG